MARELDDHGVRMYLGREAGRRAYFALSFRALGVSMWVLTGVWGVVVLLKSLEMALRADDRLFDTGWWALALLTPVFAIIGMLGYRLFHVWERRALGDHYGEIRLRPRPDPN